MKTIKFLSVRTNVISMDNSTSLSLVEAHSSHVTESPDHGKEGSLAQITNGLLKGLSFVQEFSKVT